MSQSAKFKADSTAIHAGIVEKGALEAYASPWDTIVCWGGGPNYAFMVMGRFLRPSARKGENSGTDTVQAGFSAYTMLRPFDTPRLKR